MRRSSDASAGAVSCRGAVMGEEDDQRLCDTRRPVPLATLLLTVACSGGDAASPKQPDQPPPRRWLPGRAHLHRSIPNVAATIDEVLPPRSIRVSSGVTSPRRADAQAALQRGAGSADLVRRRDRPLPASGAPSPRFRRPPTTGSIRRTTTPRRWRSSGPRSRQARRRLRNARCSISASPSAARLLRGRACRPRRSGDDGLGLRRRAEADRHRRPLCRECAAGKGLGATLDALRAAGLATTRARKRTLAAYRSLAKAGEPAAVPDASQGSDQESSPARHGPAFRSWRRACASSAICRRGAAVDRDRSTRARSWTRSRASSDGMASSRRRDRRRHAREPSTCRWRSASGRSSSRWSGCAGCRS